MTCNRQGFRAVEAAFALLSVFLLLTGFLRPSAEASATTATPTEDKPTAPKRIPVILDTDIGDDIDDTWALAFLLKSPELDLKLVVTDYGNTEYRAKIAARLLEVAGRTDVPVGIGIKQDDREGGQAAWVKGYDLSKYPGKVHRDGVQALIDTILGSPEPVTLICIGPVPNIKAALDREPRIAGRARFVGMHGSVRRGYDGKKEPDAEYNVKADAGACRRALSAAWDVTITPLDTCGLVQLKGEKYAAVKGSKDPLARAVIANYRIWCGKNPERADKESSILFDTVAVYLGFSEKSLSLEKISLSVTGEGFTVADPRGKTVSCAVDWKSLPDFEDLLAERVGGK